MNEHTYSVLQETLTVAVPMWIDLLAETTFEQRAARAFRCAQIVGNHGDAILYLVPTKGPVKVTKTDAAHPGWARDSYSNVGTAAAFNALAEGIACAAYQPGGIKCFGLHFEAHERPRQRPPGRRRRPIEDVSSEALNGCGCGCHAAVQPGLIPCPACDQKAEHSSR